MGMSLCYNKIMKKKAYSPNITEMTVMKLSKAQMNAHNAALNLIHSDKALNIDERFFIIDNYREDALHMNAAAGAFFTPSELALSMQAELPSNAHVVDLCAGIGALSLLTLINNSPKSLTCIELNPEYVAAGKRVLPEADWICADALAYDFDRKFDLAISNPPFGMIKTSDWKGHYSGSKFEYKVLEKASLISEYAAFIIPAESAGFIQSGVSGRQERPNIHLQKLTKETGIILEASCIDTSFALDDWRGTKPKVEIVLSEFKNKIAQQQLLLSA
jgi:predicted RNA methylase